MARTSRRTTLAGIAATMLARPAFASERFDCIVIGAGLSGLAAAGILTAAGMRIVVVEASSRVGGRLLTVSDLPDAPNAGGTQIGGSYERLRMVAAALGVPIKADAGEPRDAALYLSGRLIPARDWPGAPENPLPSALKSATPGSLLFRLAGPDNPLRGVEDWMSSDRDVSAEAFLRSKGLNDAGLHLADVGLNANRLSTYSMLNVWRSLTLFAADAAIGPTGGVEGGSERLAAAMAAPLGDRVRLNAEVAAIDVETRRVRVRLATGGSISAPFAICTTPFPALRRIALDAPLPPAQRAAIAGLPYTQIAQIFFEPAIRYWEKDGAPADMWTDTPLERLFAVRNRATQAPNGLMLAWLNGDGCAWIAGKSDSEVEAVVGATLARIRPASEGRVKLARVVRWTSENALAGGAYMHFAPGQIAAWAATMGAPAGRLHFAGEHLSQRHTGMEGAMESAERAAQAVLKAAA